MIFTIQLERVEDRPGLTLNDLKAFHGECGGGRHELSYSSGDEEIPSHWYFTCKRCELNVVLRGGTIGEALFVLKTAIDGQRRELRAEEVVLVPRTEAE